jgi:DcuC family C4-dicarboxylate transporter
MPDYLAISLGCTVIIAVAIAIVRGLDVRLALIGGALVLATLAGDPALVLRSFFNTFSNERYVIPICSAMGFAYVLRRSGCDRQMVLMLIQPIRRVRPLLIPGAIAVGFFVNIAVISQASTAIAVGMVIIPLLRSVGFSPVVVGSALLLGASIGGELLNPGAPELQSVAKVLSEFHSRDFDSRRMQPVIAPLLLVQLLTATVLFWWRTRNDPRCETEPEELELPPRVNVIQAIVPLLPLAFLMSAGPPLNLFAIPKTWLISPDEPGIYASRLIGASMLLGAVIAVAVVPTSIRDLARAFFDGAGYAFTSIVSIIVAANCFGESIKALRLGSFIEWLTLRWPKAVWPLAGASALVFAIICGSGMATTESIYQFFAQKELDDTTNLRIGAVVSIAAAAGRTTSPAAAVVLLCASLVSVSPLELIRRVSMPLVAATAVTVVVAYCI